MLAFPVASNCTVISCVTTVGGVTSCTVIVTITLSDFPVQVSVMAIVISLLGASAQVKVS